MSLNTLLEEVGGELCTDSRVDPIRFGLVAKVTTGRTKDSTLEGQGITASPVALGHLHGSVQNSAGIEGTCTGMGV